MILAAIDPGSNATGYAFLEQPSRTPAGAKGKETGVIKVLEYGVIRSKPKESLPQKLHRIHQTLDSFFKLYAPKHLAMETAFVAKYPRAALVLGHTRGAIMVCATQHNMDVFEYEPRVIKNSVVGTGSASKAQVAGLIQQHLQLTKPPTPSDAADALAVGYCHLIQSRQI